MAGLFSGRANNTRRNFRAAANPQTNAPQVIAQSGDSRLTMYDDNSLGGIVARNHFTRQYGVAAGNAASRRGVIEVQGANGQWAPVNQANPGAPMDAQLASLQAFRQTGQLGADGQGSLVTSQNLPGGNQPADTSNTLLFGGSAGAAAGAAAPILQTTLAPIGLGGATGGALALPSDPSTAGTLGGADFVTGPGAAGGAGDLGAITLGQAAADVLNDGQAALPAGNNTLATPGLVGQGPQGPYQSAGAGPQGPYQSAGNPVIRSGNAGNASGQGQSATAATGGIEPQSIAFQDPAMQGYADAITSIESAGQAAPYQALGPVMNSGSYTGDRAYGRYQVMGRNVPEWTKQALGVTMTPEQFLADPAAQDAVFADQFQRNIAKYGSPQDAAAVWFTGRPVSSAAGQRASDGNITGAQYVARFNAALGGTAPTGTSGPPTGGPNPAHTARNTSVANTAQDQSGTNSSPTTNQDDTLISNAHQFAPVQNLTSAGGSRGPAPAPQPVVQIASLAPSAPQYKFF